MFPCFKIFVLCSSYNRSTECFVRLRVRSPGLVASFLLIWFPPERAFPYILSLSISMPGKQLANLKSNQFRERNTICEQVLISVLLSFSFSVGFRGQASQFMVMDLISFPSVGRLIWKRGMQASKVIPIRILSIQPNLLRWLMEFPSYLRVSYSSDISSFCPQASQAPAISRPAVSNKQKKGSFLSYCKSALLSRSILSEKPSIWAVPFFRLAMAFFVSARFPFVTLNTRMWNILSFRWSGQGIPWKFLGLGNERWAMQMSC